MEKLFQHKLKLTLKVAQTELYQSFNQITQLIAIYFLILLKGKNPNEMD